MPGNGDIKVELEPQRAEKRTQADRPTSDREFLEAGYRSIDRASTSEFGNKERQGPGRPAHYPRRYS